MKKISVEKKYSISYLLSKVIIDSNSDNYVISTNKENENFEKNSFLSLQKQATELLVNEPDAQNLVDILTLRKSQTLLGCSLIGIIIASKIERSQKKSFVNLLLEEDFKPTETDRLISKTDLFQKWNMGRTLTKLF